MKLRTSVIVFGLGHVLTGAVLSQVTDGKEVVIAYFSKALSKAQRQYCVTRRELHGQFFSVNLCIGLAIAANSFIKRR
jgi:hypothetical protein